MIHNITCDQHVATVAEKTYGPMFVVDNMDG